MVLDLQGIVGRKEPRPKWNPQRVYRISAVIPCPHEPTRLTGKLAYRRLLPDQCLPDLASATIPAVICEVLPLVCPVLEPVRAVTHVPELDALRGATDEAKEQDATLPLSQEPVAIPSEVLVVTRHGSAEPDATHVVEQRAVQVRDVLLVLPRATRGAGPVGILNVSPELDEIRFVEALPTAIRSSGVPWCEVPVAKAWSSIHLVGACCLVRLLTEPGAIRYGL